MSKDIEKFSFAPIVNAKAKLLILGSLPGEASLRASQYYAHPQNQFWRLLGNVIGVTMPDNYQKRLKILQAAHIGLWDVVKSARRVGSLDANIIGHKPNVLAELITELPALKAIAFNGGTASRIGRKQIPADTRLTLLDLPSSSPAYTLAFDKKRKAWEKALRPYIKVRPTR